MRFFASFICTLYCVVTAMADPLPNDSADYSLGATIGGCLVVRCEVYRGFVLSDSPKSGEPVTIRVEEVLYGRPNGRDDIKLPYEDLAHAGSGDGGGYLASAWAGVRPSRNLPVTVVFALESGFLFRAGEPVFVTSSEREAGIIGSLIEKAYRLEASPDLISELMASLSTNADPCLAGYLFTYLTLGKNPPPTDIAESLLSK